ncbi:universal stress protein [Candidatus Oscillochloris fontis]|uniref:universal stress protein n=1 Tax=Candidatus Oscillochloris fontis TaxID=2496868 RepID=UPI00101D7C4A|nr:universal stress protein [Candidatus Oscillochloris fontis]
MKTILVPLDGSPFGEHALPAALAIARQWSAQIKLLHVHEMVANTLSPAGTPFFDPDVDLALCAHEQNYLAEVAARIAQVWGGPVEHTVLRGVVADAICTYAHEVDTGMIVLSTHGRGGLARAWLGSVADRVIRQSQIPTLAIHPTDAPLQLDQSPQFDHILIPLDGTELAEQATNVVLQMRGSHAAHLDLVRVVEPLVHGFTLSGVEPVIDVEAQEQAWQQATLYVEEVAVPLRAKGHVVMTYAPIGHIANALLERAEKDGVALIAMTTHGRKGMARMFMGSVADKVLRSTTLPVLIYRPPDE